MIDIEFLDQFSKFKIYNFNIPIQEIVKFYIIFQTYDIYIELSKREFC